MSEAVIEVDHLWTRYGEQVVHADVSLAVYRGEALSIVGRLG